MASWWPWRRATPEPPPRATHTAPAAPGAQQWRWLPPVQRATADIEMTVPLAGFTASLTTARAPIFGSPMRSTIDGDGLLQLRGARSDTPPPVPGRSIKAPAGRMPSVQRRTARGTLRAAGGPAIGSATVTPTMRPELIEPARQPERATEHPMTVAEQPDENRVLPPIDESIPEPGPEPGNDIPTEYPAPPPTPATTVAGGAQPDSPEPPSSRPAAASPASEGAEGSSVDERPQVQRLSVPSIPPVPGADLPRADLPATINRHERPHVRGAHRTSADSDRPSVVAPPPRPVDHRPPPPSRSIAADAPRTHPPVASSTPISPAVARMTESEAPSTVSSMPSTTWIEDPVGDPLPLPTAVEPPNQPLDNTDRTAPPPSGAGRPQPPTGPAPLPSLPLGAAAVQRTETPPDPATARTSFPDSGGDLGVRTASAVLTDGEQPRGADDGSRTPTETPRPLFPAGSSTDAPAAGQRLVEAGWTSPGASPSELASWDSPFTASSVASDPAAPSVSHAWTPPRTLPPRADAGMKGIGAPVRRAAPVQRSNPAPEPGLSGKVHRVSAVEPPLRTPGSVLDNSRVSPDCPLVGAAIASPTTPVDGASVQRATGPAVSIAARPTQASPVQRGLEVSGRGLEEGGRPERSQTMSLQQMFEPVRVPSSGPDPSLHGAEGSAAVQHESVPTPPAPTVPTAVPSPSVAAGATGSVNVDELATRLYEPLVTRIRAELWLDRERAGVLTDPRR